MDISSITHQANFTLDAAAIDRDPHNVTPLFLQLLNVLGDTGKCWVSIYCYLPEEFLSKALFPALEATGANLKIFYNTVVKSVNMSEDGTRILSLTVKGLVSYRAHTLSDSLSLLFYLFLGHSKNC
jgi:hypothetical protein